MPPKRSRSERAPLSDARSTSPAPSFLPSSTLHHQGRGQDRDDDADDADDDDDLLPPDNGNLLGDDDDAVDEEEEEGEDLFGDAMTRDYQAKELLDRYEAKDIDETFFEGMDPVQRAQVEAELRERDLREGRGRERLPAAFLGEADEFAMAQENARRRRRMDEELDAQDESDEIDPAFPLEDLKGATIADWVTIARTRRHIKYRFNKFLVTYVDDAGTAVYAERIKAMCEANQESLLISYEHLTAVEPAIAYFLAQAPAQVLPILDETCFEVVLSIFTDYDRIRREVKARIVDVPAADSLRDLRYIHLNRLVRVFGVVTRRTAVLPQLKYVKYDCVKCGSVLGPYYQDVSSEIKIGACPNCESRGPFPVNSEQTTYRNYQKLSLQESPGSVPPGRLPRSKEVVLLGDLVDSARPGEEIEVTGIYMNNWDIGLNLKNGFPVFATILEANSINKKEDQFAAFRLTEDEKRDIRNLARDDRIGKRIIKSIAPSIYGHENIKTAIALSLFGGESKNIQNKHRIRGDINILLLGDPGTAKSQFLKYIEKTAHRAVYTTGQGATAVGLTATVRKDPVTREWTLEGGALVLADKGVCLIDEFDKMNDADRTSIHEAMEQQSISISKAGIVTSLQARCSVIAAANPIKGRYIVSQTFLENVDLTEPILSRFDCLCVVRDTVDPLMDEQLARFVVNSHRTSHPSASYSKHAPVSIKDDDIINQDLLRKYIMFAKEKTHPKLQQMDQDKVARLYADLRRESINCNSIPITARHLESIIRMAEANAKMHLREHVRADDVNLAIRVMLESFISANKIGVMKTLRKRFSKYLSYMRDTDELLLYLLRQLTKNNMNYHQYKYKEIPDAVEIDMDELEAKARDYDIHQLEPFYESTILAQNGYEVDTEERKLLKTF